MILLFFRILLFIACIYVLKDLYKIMKYIDLFDISVEELKHNLSKIDSYCRKHDLPSIVALQLRHAVDFMNATACCSMRFRYPDCNIGITLNENIGKFIFELHIPIF